VELCNDLSPERAFELVCDTGGEVGIVTRCRTPRRSKSVDRVTRG
jgi:hypothetical protein